MSGYFSIGKYFPKTAHYWKYFVKNRLRTSLLENFSKICLFLLSITGNNYPKITLYWKKIAKLASNFSYSGKYFTHTASGAGLFVKRLQIEQANIQTGKSRQD